MPCIEQGSFRVSIWPHHGIPLEPDLSFDTTTTPLLGNKSKCNIIIVCSDKSMKTRRYSSSNSIVSLRPALCPPRQVFVCLTTFLSTAHVALYSSVSSHIVNGKFVRLYDQLNMLLGRGDLQHLRQLVQDALSYRRHSHSGAIDFERLCNTAIRGPSLESE